MSASENPNDLPRPVPPSRETPGWQVGLVTGIGAVITALVVLAIQQSYRTTFEVGAALIVAGILLAIGLIAASPLTSRIAAIGLFVGGVAVLALGFARDNPLWMAGGLVVFLAGELVLLRDRFLPRRG